jgi:CBS domain-containing protein
MTRYGYGDRGQWGGRNRAGGYEGSGPLERQSGWWERGHGGSQGFAGGPWSRPEFNTSLDRGGRADRGGGYSTDGWGSYDVRGGRGGSRGWRTGEPWGDRDSPAQEVLAADLMTENPEAVTPDTTLADVARRMRDLDVGIIPVVDHLDRYMLQGVITDRDIAVRAAAEGKDMMSTTVGDYMTEDVATVQERDTVRDIFTVMKRERVRRVPVTDSSGRLVGIVAQADLAVDYAGLDEEREMEVEEVIGRISEPARPASRGGGRFQGNSFPAGGYAGGRFEREYDMDIRDRLRRGWRTLRRGASDLFNRDSAGYDRGWR